MDRAVADTPDTPSLGEMATELWGSVRGLVADEADLIAAEAHVALQTLMLGIVVAVLAAVFFVLGAGAILAVIAVSLVERGMTWPAAFGVVFLVCAGLSVALLLALRGIALRKLFTQSRRELRGRG